MIDKVLVPPIKSQGIKTKLVPWIRSIIPSDFEGLWIEPFMGTGVVGFNVQPTRALMADTNPHLINFYSALKSGDIDGQIVKDFLEEEGAKLLKNGQEHYYAIRERFNKDHNPLDFLFCNRSGFNGMIRFNKKGGFNIPFCRKPNRFAQAYVTKIVNQTNRIREVIRGGDYNFVCQTFQETVKAARQGDLIYCDPPYIDRHTDYYNGWDGGAEAELSACLSRSQARFILSTWDHNDFRKNDYLWTAWSSFHKINREHFYHVGASEKNRNPMVEALVCNFEPHAHESQGPVQMTLCNDG